MPTFFKVEFLLEKKVSNSQMASVLLDDIRQHVKPYFDTRYCFEANVDSQTYLYVSTGARISDIEYVRRELTGILTQTGVCSMGVVIGTIYAVSPQTVVTPLGRTIQDVFSLTTGDLAKLGLVFWEETLQGAPGVMELESGEVVLTTNLYTDSGNRLTEKKS